MFLPTGNGGEQRPRAGVATSQERAAPPARQGGRDCEPSGAGKEPPPQAGTRREKGGKFTEPGHRKLDHTEKDNQPHAGFPAKMALCESTGREAAGDGDESAARVDADYEQPVKHAEISFLTSRVPVTREGMKRSFAPWSLCRPSAFPSPSSRLGREQLVAAPAWMVRRGRLSKSLATQGRVWLDIEEILHYCQ